MEVSLMKSISIQNQPAQYRIELADDFLYAPSQPWQPGARPSRTYVQHIDVAFACAFHKLCKKVRAGDQGIAKRKRHSRTFISKASILQFDSLEFLTERFQFVLLQGRVISHQKLGANMLQAISDLRFCAGKPATRKCNFTAVDA